MRVKRTNTHTHTHNARRKLSHNFRSNVGGIYVAPVARIRSPMWLEHDYHSHKSILPASAREMFREARKRARAQCMTIVSPPAALAGARAEKVRPTWHVTFESNAMVLKMFICLKNVGGFFVCDTHAIACVTKRFCHGKFACQIAIVSERELQPM